MTISLLLKINNERMRQKVKFMDVGNTSIKNHVETTGDQGSPVMAS